MTLAIDLGSRQVRTLECPCCGIRVERSSGYVRRDDVAHAVYFASCYHHEPGRETFLDVVLGTWGADVHTDHATFGCRIMPAGADARPACQLVTGGEVAIDDALFGDKLSRERALAHVWLTDFWDVVDVVLTDDPTVRAHIYR